MIVVGAGLGLTGCFDPRTPPACAVLEEGAAPCEAPAGDAPPIDPADARPASTGETCSTAPLLGELGNIQGTNAGAIDDYHAEGLACAGSYFPGPDVVYQLALPAGQRLHASVRAEGRDVGLMLVTAEACAIGIGGDCLAADDSGDVGAADAFTFVSTSAQTVFLIVDEFFAGPGGPFTLTLALLPADQGETCDTPQPLPGTTGMIFGQTVDGYANDVDTVACLPGASFPGADRFYAVTVPGGAAREVILRPNVMTDLALYVLGAAGAGGCAAEPVACVVGADAGSEGAAERLSLPVDPQDRTYVIGVDTHVGDEPNRGTFSLELARSP